MNERPKHGYAIRGIQGPPQEVSGGGLDRRPGGSCCGLYHLPNQGFQTFSLKELLTTEEVENKREKGIEDED